MQNFKEFTKFYKTKNEILTVTTFLSEADLNESFIKLVRTNKSLYDYILKAGSTIGHMILLAYKAYHGDKKSERELKEFIDIHDIKESEVVDFLMKLDGATLNILSAPLNFIENVTGWSFKVDYDESQLKQIKKSINSIMNELQADYDAISIPSIKREVGNSLNILKKLTSTPEYEYIYGRL